MSSAIVPLSVFFCIGMVALAVIAITVYIVQLSQENKNLKWLLVVAFVAVVLFSLMLDSMKKYADTHPEVQQPPAKIEGGK